MDDVDDFPEDHITPFPYSKGTAITNIEKKFQNDLVEPREHLERFLSEGECFIEGL